MLSIGNHEGLPVVTGGGFMLANRHGKSVAPGRGVGLPLVRDVTLIKIYSALPLDNKTSVNRLLIRGMHAHSHNLKISSVTVGATLLVEVQI
jgi:hypothetical protein